MTEYVNAIVKLDKIALSPSYGSVIALNDGRLMWVWGDGTGKPTDLVRANFSDDLGATWSDPTPLTLVSGQPMKGLYATHLVRLKGGAIGLIHMHVDGQQAFHKSLDEGKTWSAGIQMTPPDAIVYSAHDVAIVLEDGRIVLPVSTPIGPKSLSASPKKVRRFSEDIFAVNIANRLSYAYAYYSDDEGQTWQRTRNETFVTLENGVKGSFSIEEPAVVEMKDGRLMMLGRTYLGQHFKSYSDDRGETWSQATPMGLTQVASPGNIRRIPSTGDLLVVWNQSSKWEVMIGLYRHRLTCAVSKDEGETWAHHRNLASLDDTTYVEPDEIEVGLGSGFRQPIDRVRYHRAPGPLRQNEPTICFIDDKVVITHSMCVFGDKAVISKTYGMDYDKIMEDWGLAPYDRGNKVRVMSTDWFYEDSSGI